MKQRISTSPWKKERNDVLASLAFSVLWSLAALFLIWSALALTGGAK